MRTSVCREPIITSPMAKAREESFQETTSATIASTTAWPGQCEESRRQEIGIGGTSGVIADDVGDPALWLVDHVAPAHGHEIANDLSAQIARHLGGGEAHEAHGSEGDQRLDDDRTDHEEQKGSQLGLETQERHDVEHDGLGG